MTNTSDCSRDGLQQRERTVAGVIASKWSMPTAISRKSAITVGTRAGAAASGVAGAMGDGLVGWSVGMISDD